MPDNEGTLHLQPSGRWAIIRPGREPVEITSGELFRVDVDGELRVTRMEHMYGEGYFSHRRLQVARRHAGGDRGAGRVTVRL